MKNRSASAAIVIVVLVGLLAGGWLLARNTQWWQDLAGTEEAADELPSNLGDIIPTAVVTRSNVADEGELAGRLRFQDRIEFVHRVDPTETVIVEEVTTPAPAVAAAPTAARGPGAAATAAPAAPIVTTVETVVEEPGQRAITGLPSPNALIEPGDVLYETDSTPVFALPGEVAAWRTIESGVIGPDVAQLHAYLAANGWGDTLEGDTWDSATTTAVQQWQTDTGQTVTGTVELGDIWFISGPIRITEVTATEGLIVVDGDPLFAYTSNSRAIQTSVAELPEGLVEATDLTARLPDGSTAPVEIRSIRGTDEGFDLILDIEIPDGAVPAVNGLEITTRWTVAELVDALTVPPEAIRRIDSGAYVVDVLEGDVVRTTEVQVIGQAGRVVAIDGVAERGQVLIP